MAYGLDFEEIYYADHERVDLGVLETYEIDIDLARDKDFKITSPEPVIPIKGFWYIKDTEYGGIIDGFDTDSDEEVIEYTGRSFRGILNSHYVDMSGKEMTIPAQSMAVVDSEGAISDDSQMVNATITECLQELVSGFGDLFVVDEPDVNESVDVTVPDYVIKSGTTVYDAMIGVANSIDFTFVLQYKSDHVIHIIPILIQDYTDYLKGSKYEGLGFQTEINSNIVNHLEMVNHDEESGEFYKMHFFTDENGGLQPYATVRNPIKDSQYITDKRNQVIFGYDEISAYEESNVSTVENYELVAEAPRDWAANFAAYYKHEFEERYSDVVQPIGNPKANGWYEKNGEEYILTEDTSVQIGKTYYEMSLNEAWNIYEAEGEEVYTHITKKPSDWATNYSSYYIRNYDETTGEWRYTNVSADSVLDKKSIKKIEKKPKDWKSNANEYYYKFQTGTGIEYRPYEYVTKNRYVKMTKKPDDWNTNFSSYYRKVYEKEVVEGGKKKKKLIDTVKHKDAKYVSCKSDDDVKDGTIPSFSKRPHYRQYSITTIPTFKKNNTYRIKRKEVAPAWDTTANYYYSMKMVYHAPKFVKGEVYAMVYDHYSGMVDQAIAFFDNEQKKSSQTMDLEDFEVNIGDIVGGTDEFTKTNVVGNINNIEARIENGLIDAKYSVTVDDYTTVLSITRQPEGE